MTLPRVRDVDPALGAPQDVGQGPLVQQINNVDQILKIVSWNIHGFYSHKSDAYLKVYLCTFDVIILSETWTKLKSSKRAHVNYHHTISTVEDAIV